MGGGLMQLVAYGAQDIYLTGNPQITFFKVVYRRHTNFAMESVQQTRRGTAGFGNKVTAVVSRNGDLVGRMYVECDPSAVIKGTQFAPNPLHQLLKEMTVEIGGQQIDKQYGHWLNVWTELTEPTNVSILDDKGDNKGVYAAAHVMRSADAAEVRVPPTPYQRMSFGVKADGVSVPDEKRAAVPLQFWFCRHAGLALPLIALQYHEVKVSLTFDTEANVSNAVTGSGSLSSVQLWADYIYLDTDERRRFAQVSHEYLIEQLQYQSSSPASTHKLNFNHPVKELIWCGQSNKTSGGTHGGSASPYDIALHNGSNDGAKLNDTDDTVTLKLNGHDRFAARHNTYFTRTQPWQHHSNPGGGFKADAISVYSFALKPEEHQPSGTCNFSRIDNAQLVFSNKVCGGNDSSGLHIYAVNYNVLRVMSGMGGLAYSN